MLRLRFECGAVVRGGDAVCCVLLQLFAAEVGWLVV